MNDKKAKTEIQSILNILHDFVDELHYTGEPVFNERHLHHYLSRGIGPSADVLVGEDGERRLHPEWPTAKLHGQREMMECPAWYFGNAPATEGRKSAAHIDFALGKYSAPEVVIELILKYGWVQEEVVWDWVKMLDPRLKSIKTAISFVLLLRPNGLSAGDARKYLEKRMDDALTETVKRLNLKSPPEQRTVILLVGERGTSKEKVSFRRLNVESMSFEPCGTDFAQMKSGR